MQYLNPVEIKKNKDKIQDKFAVKPGRRPLALKGRNIDIFEKFILDKNSAVLDLGSGSGAFLKAIWDRGYKKISGGDIDNYLADEFKRFVSDFKTFDASFDSLPWSDSSFDVITAWQVFEHLENPHNAIREIHRALSDKGLFIFSIPNIFHIISRLIFLKAGLFPRWNEKNNHISVYPHGIFEKSFLKYFELVEEGYTHPKISLPILKKIKFLPENKWFGTWVYYVLKKRI